MVLFMWEIDKHKSQGPEIRPGSSGVFGCHDSLGFLPVLGLVNSDDLTDSSTIFEFGFGYIPRLLVRGSPDWF